MGKMMSKSKIQHLKRFCLASIFAYPFFTSQAIAQNVSINFDDIPEGAISNGYKNLDWNNFSILNSTTYSINPSGYLNGTVSPSNVAYNAYANPAYFESTRAFTLRSAYITGAWNNGLQVTVTGYRNGSQAYTQTYTVNSTSPTQITFNWSNLSKVNFSSAGGTDGGYAGGGEHFALDDLLISYGPSAADTQQSLVNTASVLQGTFTLQNSVMVNGFTYDCPVFDKNGVCISAGGRNTTVQTQGINNTNGLLIASYRLDKNNSRIGAWVDQNLSMSGPGTVQLNNSTPMIGLFGVWSQRPDGVGAEVKVSAAYGQKDLTVTRQIVGTSEAGSGGSQLISQGAQVVGKYGFAVMSDVVVSPYAGIRYTQNNMGGYTEAGSSAVTAPLTYSALNTNATTALAGAEARYRGIPQTTLFASAGVETDTNTSAGSYSATGVDGLTPVNFNPNPVKTRPTATVGGYYDITKSQRFGVTGIYRQEPFQAVSTTTVLATYTIGL
jgi:Autotransporter beta-domain